MSVQSLAFLAFLTVTVLACLWAGSRDRRAGAWLLLAACAVFCLWGFPDRKVLGGFLVLLGGCVVTWAAARDFPAHPKRKKAVFLMALVWLTGTLLWYKYAGAFTGGWMPLGLSFFTFQQIWYLKEVYTGEAEPVGRKDYLLYTFFFPTLTSGPILRPSAFFPQLNGETFLRPGWRDISAALYAISLGMAKKVLLADALGTVVSNGWAMLADLSAPGAWLVMLAYTLQLYLDFSGYCDIAAGCARLLGIRLPVNFDSPYRALSVGEFWKRWHITLTTFLRECLYFPLGGSRKGNARTYLNILIVYLVSGVWHGAGWTFLVWGGLHGLAQIVERAWGPRRERLPRALRWLMTFLFVNLAWVFFRAPSLGAAGGLLSAAVSGGAGLPLSALAAGVLDSETTALTTLLPMLAKQMPGLVLAALLAASLTVSLWPRNTIRRMEDFHPSMWRGAACAGLLVWSVLSFSGVTTFIYSNF